MDTAYLRQRAEELLREAYAVGSPAQRAGLVSQAAELLSFAQLQELEDRFRPRRSYAGANETAAIGAKAG